MPLRVRASGAVPSSGEPPNDRAASRKVTSSSVWHGQWHQLVRRLRRLRDERAAVAIGCGDETRSHVVSEERNFRDVGSILDRQDAPGVAAVLRVPQRRVEPDGDIRQVDAFLRAEVRYFASEGRGPVEPQRAGWTGERQLTRIGHLNFQHRVGGDCCGCVARLLLDDRGVGDLQMTAAVIPLRGGRRI